MAEERRMQFCCVHAMYEATSRDLERTRDLLINYFKGPKGRRELADSPHRNRPVEEFVDDLLQGVKSPID